MYALIVDKSAVLDSVSRPEGQCPEFLNEKDTKYHEGQAKGGSPMWKLKASRLPWEDFSLL